MQISAWIPGNVDVRVIRVTIRDFTAGRFYAQSWDLQFQFVFKLLFLVGEEGACLDFVCNMYGTIGCNDAFGEFKPVKLSLVFKIFTQVCITRTWRKPIITIRTRDGLFTLALYPLFLLQIMIYPKREIHFFKSNENRFQKHWTFVLTWVTSKGFFYYSCHPSDLHTVLWLTYNYSSKMKWKS